VTHHGRGVVIDLGGGIDAEIEQHATAALVEAFFDPAGPFAGATFDTLGRNVPNSVTTDDLVAVSMLDVSFRPRAVRALLATRAADFSRLLDKLPVNTPIWLAARDDLEAITRAWRFLREQEGIDWVIASKLLARKRPHLVPILDSVIKGALTPARGAYWSGMRDALADESRRTRIEALRGDGVPPEVTTLRLVDVAIWMRRSRSRNARLARERAGVKE